MAGWMTNPKAAASRSSPARAAASARPVPCSSPGPASTSPCSRARSSKAKQREHSSTVARSDTTPLPGSLTATADLIRAEGRDALVLFGDLLDRASLGAAATTVLERWGRVDVLVNNARYIGPGHMDRLLDTPLELLDRHLDANVMAPLVLSRLLLPQMIERGTGLIANITSGVAWMDPGAPAGAGGWGLGYAISKGALHRRRGRAERRTARHRGGVRERRSGVCRH